MHDVLHSFFQQDIHCFSSACQCLLTYAQDSAVQFGQDRILPEHVLHAILRHNPEDVNEILMLCNVKADLFCSSLETMLQPRRSFFGRSSAPAKPAGPIEVSRETEELYMRARRDAGKLFSPLVHVSHLLLALSMEREGHVISNLFEKHKLTRTDIYLALQKNPELDGRLSQKDGATVIANGNVNGQGNGRSNAMDGASHSRSFSSSSLPGSPSSPTSSSSSIISSSSGGHSRTGAATRARVGAVVESALERFAHNLTEQAQRGELDPLIGRASELQQLIEALLRRTKNSPVLVGEPGVGKTAIVEGLAQAIVRNQVPAGLRGRSIVSLDLASLLAGAKYRGEFEERMKAVLQEISSDPSGMILFIDEVHTITGAGRTEGSMDLANLLKPALARGQIQCIGATTTAEYRLYIDKDATLERRFSPIQVLEPSRTESVRMLEGLRLRYEDYHHITISDAAIHAAVELSSRYIHDRYLPDKAIDL
ncbi:MAG: AAA family ATPase, partial [Candidatus Methylacidiphilales bacterium]